MENMLNNTVNLNLTLECLRAAACGGDFEEMDEVALFKQLRSQLDLLRYNGDSKKLQTQKHDIYCKIAAAALIMAMRLDHVDKVYE